MSTSLPERPDLDQLPRQAKELRDTARGGDPAAAECFARRHSGTPQGVVTLAGAQLVADADEQIVDISGSLDRSSALTRASS